MLNFEEVANANFDWSEGKNAQLQRERGISFEEVVRHIRRMDLLYAGDHPNQTRYPGQFMFIVHMRSYAYMVPAVKTESGYFLKTAFPNRNAVRDYLL